MPFIPIAVGLAAAGSLLGGVSAFSSGQFQAAIAKRNAAIATQNAGKSSDASQNAGLQSDRAGAALLGRQVAIQGSSGLSGASQYMLRQQTQDSLAQDRLNISLEGLAESRNNLQEAANYRAQASQATTQSIFGLAGGVLGAGSSLAGLGGSGGSSLLGGSKASYSKITSNFQRG